MALVLSRKPGESIRIFNNTEETISIKPGEEIVRVGLARVAGDKARITIEAPNTLKILRNEIKDADTLIKFPLPDTQQHADAK